LFSYCIYLALPCPLDLIFILHILFYSYSNFRPCTTLHYTTLHCTALLYSTLTRLCVKTSSKIPLFNSISAFPSLESSQGSLPLSPSSSVSTTFLSFFLFSIFLTFFSFGFVFSKQCNVISHGIMYNIALHQIVFTPQLHRKYEPSVNRSTC
jgi:hypothetical protein